MSKKTAIIDLDAFKYALASVGENRSVLVKHKETGWEREFKNRTEFYGHYKNKSGGWLGELNKSRDVKVSPDAFEFTDIQEKQPIENVLHTAKLMVDGALEASGADDYKAFLGKGQSFRVELSTLLKYKGNRDGMLKPLYLDEISDYLCKRYKAEVITDIENDDMCVIEAYKKPNRFVLGCDKDFFSCPINFYDMNQPERGIVDCTGFGSLYKDSKGKIRGSGRLHFYWQVLGQDDSDNYKAHCFSDVYWGETQAYNALVNCKDDKEALQSLVSSYQHLYPEPKVVKGWRGDDIEIDWLYVAEENFQLARMLRTKEDSVYLRDVLKSVGVLGGTG